MKTCTTCHRRVRPCDLASDGKRGPKATCRPCASDDRKLRNPLPEIPRDAVQVRLNNAAALWFYPAQRTNLLRYAP